jgi:hypothetical protein
MNSPLQLTTVTETTTEFEPNIIVFTVDTNYLGDIDYQNPGGMSCYAFNNCYTTFTITGSDYANFRVERNVTKIDISRRQALVTQFNNPEGFALLTQEFARRLDFLHVILGSEVNFVLDELSKQISKQETHETTEDTSVG